MPLTVISKNAFYTRRADSQVPTRADGSYEVNDTDNFLYTTDPGTYERLVIYLKMGHLAGTGSLRILRNDVPLVNLTSTRIGYDDPYGYFIRTGIYHNFDASSTIQDEVLTRRISAMRVEIIT